MAGTKGPDLTRGFLGLANYFSKFIKDHARIAMPLTELLKKDCFGQWGEPQQMAFEELKNALMTAPVLRVADQSCHSMCIRTRQDSRSAAG